MGEERAVPGRPYEESGGPVKLLDARPARARRSTRVVSAALVAVILGGCATGMTDRGDLVVSAPAVAVPEQGTIRPADLKEFEGMVSGAGMPVVVNVWASWCAPCRAEAPLLARAAKRYRGKVTFLGVLSRDSPGAGLKFMRTYAVGYPSVLDATSEISPFLRVNGLPTTLVFDRHGALVTRVFGGISEQRLAASIDESLRAP